MHQSNHLKDEYQKLMSTKLNQGSSTCPICLRLIEVKSEIDSLEQDREGQFVKDHLKSVPLYVRCNCCKLLYHEECAGRFNPTFKSKKLSAKVFECDNCLNKSVPLSEKSCVVCGQQTGCLKLVQKIGSRHYFGHPMCLYFSPNFVFTGKSTGEFMPVNASTLESYNDFQMGDHSCVICCKPIHPADSYFKCYCDVKSHIYCAFYVRAIASELDENNDTENFKTPIVYLNDYKKQEHTCQLSFDSAFYLLNEKEMEKTLEEHPTEFYKEKLSQKIEDQHFIFYRYLFTMSCGSCSESMCQYCCGRSMTESYVMCCICSDWVHKGEACMESSPEDKKALSLLLKDAKQTPVPSIVSRSQKTQSKAVKKKNSKGDKKKKSSKEFDEEKLDDEFSKKFFSCKNCTSIAVFLSQLSEPAIIVNKPFNFLTLQFLNRLVREHLIQNPDNFDRIVKKFNESLILKNEDFTVRAFVKKALESAQSSNEIDSFETQIDTFLKKEKLNIEEFEIIRIGFMQKVKPLGKDKDKRNETVINIAYYEEMLSITASYIDIDIELDTSRLHSRLKRFVQNEKFQDKRVQTSTFVRFLRLHFLDPLCALLRAVEQPVVNSNSRMNALFDKLLNKNQLQVSDVFELLENKTRENDLKEKIKSLGRGIIVDHFWKNNCMPAELVKFLSSFKVSESYKYEELKEKFDMLIACKSFDIQLMANAQAFVEKYFAIIQAKKEFDKTESKLRALKDFHPKTFLDNLANINRLPTFEDMQRLKNSEFRDSLYNSFFSEAENRSLRNCEQITGIIRVYNQDILFSRITKIIKQILEIVFSEQIFVDESIKQFILSGVDQYKIYKVMKVTSQEKPTLDELNELDGSVTLQNCNRYIYTHFKDRVKAIRNLEEEIKNSLGEASFFSVKIAQKVSTLLSKTKELNYKNAMLENIKRNCDFMDEFNSMVNNQIHFDLTAIEEYNLEKLDQYLDKDVPFECLERLRAYKLEKFAFKETEHLYKKAVSKYYESLVRLCVSGTRNLRISWLKDDAQLRNYFTDSAKFEFDEYVTLYHQIENDILNLLKEFNKDDEILANLMKYIEKIDEILEKSERFEIDDLALKKDLNFLFDLRFYFTIYWNMQWFLSIVHSTSVDPIESNPDFIIEEPICQSNKAESRLMTANPYETPQRIRSVMLPNQIPSGTLKSENPQNDSSMSLLYSAFLKNTANKPLLLWNPSKSSTIGDKNSSTDNSDELNQRKVLELLDKCRITNEFLNCCSRFFTPSNDLRIEHMIKQFKEGYTQFVKVKTEVLDLVQRIQKSQIDPTNFDTKIDEKEIQKMTPKLLKYKLFVSESINLLKNVSSDFQNVLGSLRKEAEEMIKRSIDELLDQMDTVIRAKHLFEETCLKSSQSEVYFVLFKRILKILNLNGKRLSEVEQKIDKFLKFMRLNFHNQSELVLISSINTKFVEINEIKDILTLLQQNEESDEAFRVHFKILQDYVQEKGFKVAFNYETYQEFENEVATITFLVENKFSEYFDALGKGKTKINPSDLLNVKIKNRFDNMTLINSYWMSSNNQSSTNKQLLQLYYFVRENTGKSCSGYEAIVIFKYNEVMSKRREFEDNFFFFDNEILTVTGDISQIIKSNIVLPSNYSPSAIEEYELNSLNCGKEFLKNNEILCYKVKYQILSILKQICFAKAGGKTFLLKDLFKKDDIKDLVKELKEVLDNRRDHSSNWVGAFHSAYLCLSDIMRYICFLVDKEKRYIEEKFPKHFCEIIDKVDIKNEQLFFGDVLIESDEELIRLGAHNLTPGILYLFKRLSQTVTLYWREEFVQLQKSMDPNNHNKGESKRYYNQIYEKFMQNPYITKNQSTIPNIEQLCFKITKTIESEQAKANATENLNETKSNIEAGPHTDTKERDPLNQSFRTQNKPRKGEDHGRQKSKNDAQSEGHATSQLYIKVMKFIRDLGKRIAICKQIEKNGFDFAEFWQLFKASDSTVRSYESPSSNNEHVKSEALGDSVVKKEEALLSNYSSNRVKSTFHPYSSSKVLSKDKVETDLAMKESFDVKRIKEHTSFAIAEEKLGEDLEGRIFQLPAIEVFLEQEKQVLTALTSKRPDTLPTVSRCQIFLKFEPKNIVDFPLQDIREKIALLKSSSEVKPLICGWFDLQLMTSSRNLRQALSILSDQKCVKNVFLMESQCWEIYICAYSVVDADIAEYIDYRPASKDSEIDFRDLYVFFMTNNNTVKHYLLEQSKNKWDILDYNVMNNNQESNAVDLTVLKNHLITHQQKLESIFQEELDLTFEYLI